MLLLGVGAFAAAYAGFAFDTTAWIALAPWFLLAGVGIGCVETAEHAAVASAAPVALRGSAFGLLAAGQSLGNFAASAIAGLLWTTLNPTASFIYLASCMAVALALLATRRRWWHGTATPTP